MTMTCNGLALVWMPRLQSKGVVFAFATTLPNAAPCTAVMIVGEMSLLRLHHLASATALSEAALGAIINAGGLRSKMSRPCCGSSDVYLYLRLQVGASSTPTPHTDALFTTTNVRSLANKLQYCVFHCSS